MNGDMCNSLREVDHFVMKALNVKFSRNSSVQVHMLKKTAVWTHVKSILCADLNLQVIYKYTSISKITE